MKHCDHCYELGYKAGRAAAKESEEKSSDDGLQTVHISLTDEIRSAYDIPSDMMTALAVVEGDRIITILATYE